MMAMLWAQQIMLGKRTFADVPRLLKDKVKEILMDSSMEITEIGKGVSRPLVGMHFFNPADRMKLIEVPFQRKGCSIPAQQECPW